MEGFEGKRVLITGGARGLGLAIARTFAREGAEPILVDLDSEALDEALGGLRGRAVSARGYVADVTDPTEVEELRDRVHEEAGPVEILVNNAGVVFGGPFLDVPLERHLATLRVNTEGLLIVTHTFLSDLIVSREGHLVNIASASGFIGLPYGSSYAASKWGVIGFSESIRLELEKQGHDRVGVTTVCPSYVDTGMFEGVEPPKLTRFLEPNEVAEKILSAVTDDDPFVLEPWIVKVTPFLARALPTKISDRLSDFFGATTGMKSWRGH